MKIITAVCYHDEVRLYGTDVEVWQKKLDKMLNEIPLITEYVKDSRIIEVQKTWEHRGVLSKLKLWWKQKGSSCSLSSWITSKQDPMLINMCFNLRAGDRQNKIKEFLEKYNFYFDKQIDDDGRLFRLDY